MGNRMADVTGRGSGTIKITNKRGKRIFLVISLPSKNSEPPRIKRNREMPEMK